MLQEGMLKSDNGFVLMITLLFIFVMTVILIAGTQDIILENKMQNSTQESAQLFSRAELGVQQKILALEGVSISLPDSAIALQVKAKIIDTDDCDNQTIDIRSVAKNSFSHVVLNSRGIFAKVPREKHCKNRPAYHVLWWNVAH
ncbi:MAG: hypothetical protein NTZ67_03945 [Gammaproteobacteria bacterium]|nr:hypothetical protein [Gammaproteobacteria bacterium]